MALMDVLGVLYTVLAFVLSYLLAIKVSKWIIKREEKIF